MTSTRAFLKGFMIGLGIFILINLLAAQLFSDCGLPAVLGMSYCSDGIARAGFPFFFFEQGGFAYRSIFNLSSLLLDILVGLAFAILYGYKRAKK